MQLYVPIASVATLRLLWLVQITKGVFSLQWPRQLARDQRVDLVVAVGVECIHFGGEVRACTPAGGGYHVQLRLDPLSDATRLAIEAALATPEEPARATDERSRW
ncbi:MAG: hypothetical protein JWM53_4918 [bacterium]|nr:hypothetical protein [bacterium]